MSNKEQKKEKKQSKFWFRIKRWFFGIGKEFGRISWISKKQLIKDFFVVIVVILIMALVFLGIDTALMSGGII